MKIPELLAPVGSKEHLKIAILSGASSIYLSGEKYGARKYAENFSIEEIKEAVDYAHIYNVKVYVTVNILIKERELVKVIDYLLELYKIGVDAVLIQDIGLVKLINENIPNLTIHASTQMNIQNIEGIKWAQKHNIKRIVLPREIKFEELKEITEYAHSVGIEIEIFAHGALCYSYSGRCLFSSFQGGRSGNRGTCAQPCRESYKLAIDKNSEMENISKNNSKNLQEISGKSEGNYLLSPRDLSLYENLDELIAIGIDSLKIEGRMRNTDYVAIVIKNYRQRLNQLRNKSKSNINTLKKIQKQSNRDKSRHNKRKRSKKEEETFKKLREEQRTKNKKSLEELELIFNREYTSGHLIPKDDQKIMNRRKPGHNGLYIGTIHRFNEQTNEIHIALKDDLLTIPEKGDGILIEEKTIDSQDIEDFNNNKKNNQKNKETAPGHLKQKSKNTYGLDISSKPILRDPKDKHWRRRDNDRNVTNRILIVKKVRENKKINIKLNKGSKVYLTKRNSIINKTKDLINNPEEHSFRHSILELYFRIDSENYPHLKGNLKLADGKVITVSIKGKEPWEKAIKKPISKETIEKQLMKIGNLPYYIDKIIINNNKDLFCPISKINEIRRDFLENLEKEIITSYQPKENDLKIAENKSLNLKEKLNKKPLINDEEIKKANEKENQELAIYLNNLDTLKKLNKINAKKDNSPIYNRVYLEIPAKEEDIAKLISKHKTNGNLSKSPELDISYCVNFLKEAIAISQKQKTETNYELVWKWPDIAHKNLKEDLIKILGILNKMDLKINIMSSLIGIEDLLKDKFELKLYGNYPLNVFNIETVLSLNNYDCLHISPELYKLNIKNLMEDYYQEKRNNPQNQLAELELLIHGNIEVLESRKDLISKKQLKTINKINSKNNTLNYYLKSKKDKYYPIKANISEEGIIMLNSEDLSLIEHIPFLKSIAISKFAIDGRWKSIDYIKEIGMVYKKTIEEDLDLEIANEILFKYSPNRTEGNFNKGLK